MKGILLFFFSVCSNIICYNIYFIRDTEEMNEDNSVLYSYAQNVIC